MKSLLILGTRSFSVELASIIEETGQFTVIGFVDNWDKSQMPSTIDGRAVYWIEEIDKAPRACYIGGLSTTFRDRFVQEIEERIAAPSFATVVHPTAHVSAPSDVGDGSFIGVRCVVGSHTRLGRHVLVNRGVLIGHHTVIGDYVTINPGANIAGMVSIGDHTYVGMGATIIDKITVGSHSVIGAGAVVTKDVPDNVLVVGVPAEIAKERIEGK